MTLPFFKPEPVSDAVLLEIDEMHHYLKKSPIRSRQAAYCRDSRQLIDWELGGRNANTFARLKSRLDKWKTRLICVDGYNVYEKAYRPGQYYVGKDQTYRIEQNNARQTHWFTRFRRKSIVVRKSLEIIDLAIGVFAAAHVNKTVKLRSSFIC